jgi:hypothetical protein
MDADGHDIRLLQPARVSTAESASRRQGGLEGVGRLRQAPKAESGVAAQMAFLVGPGWGRCNSAGWAPGE